MNSSSESMLVLPTVSGVTADAALPLPLRLAGLLSCDGGSVISLAFLLFRVRGGVVTVQGSPALISPLQEEIKHRGTSTAVARGMWMVPGGGTDWVTSTSL
jgi:hypothetical protein